MACLFGYCGPPADGLLARMAGLLAHRCPLGWERARGATATGDTVEIGHGVATWNRESQLARRGSELLGYGGVLFEIDALAEGDDSPARTVAARLLAVLHPDPEARIARLTGAFVLAASQGDTFYLARDPAGVKVLYWTVHQGRLLFASEIKALFADPTLPRRMRAGALPEYLSFSFIPGANTLFAGIEELPPGSILAFRRGRAQVRRYFRVEELEMDLSRPAEESSAIP